MKKKLNKKLLDELIELNRAYQGMWREGEEAMTEQCRKMVDKALEIEADSKIFWSAINDFCSGILMLGGLKGDAENEEIYRALEIFGWELDGGTDECTM